MLTEVFAHIDAHRDQYLAELFPLLRQPSISATGQGVQVIGPAAGSGRAKSRVRRRDTASRFQNHLPAQAPEDRPGLRPPQWTFFTFLFR